MKSYLRGLYEVFPLLEASLNYIGTILDAPLRQKYLEGCLSTRKHCCSSRTLHGRFNVERDPEPGSWPDLFPALLAIVLSSAASSFTCARVRRVHQKVFVYEATAYEGEPKESEEMQPKWFRETELPQKVRTHVVTCETHHPLRTHLILPEYSVVNNRKIVAQRSRSCTPQGEQRMEAD